MKEITILAFNFGNAGKYPNGPGICLFNFVKFLRDNIPELKINVFTQLKSEFSVNRVSIFNLNRAVEAYRAIDRSDIVHHWSGIGEQYIDLIKYANNKDKKVLVGPNVIDCVEFEKERNFLKNIHFDKLLAVNDRLKFLISKNHKINLDKISVFMVGPDVELWKPSKIKTNTILWKGNSRQFVKDVNFALGVSKRLDKKYKVEFIGHPNPYDYFKHIHKAKRAKLYFSTSFSETMGLGLVEQWAAGIPSVTHPKIYLHGINYETGIITNRKIEDYCDAIVEIMENDTLYERLSVGARKFAVDNFSGSKVIQNYIKILINI